MRRLRMQIHTTTPEIEIQIGMALRARRLQKKIDQATLAERAGVGLNAVKHLESGAGSTLKSLIAVVRALGQEDWFNALAPEVSISPLEMARRPEPRKRAPRRHT
jgi:transcriptional regulator with XRE-family HTH domain